jgi:putative flippase GtrA
VELRNREGVLGVRREAGGAEGLGSSIRPKATRLVEEKTSQAGADPSGRVEEETEKARELARKYGLKAAAFGVAGVIGFLVLEAILIAGLYVAYGKVEIPSNVASSPTLLALDIFASVIGVVAGFFVNERMTFRDLTALRRDTRNTLVRLGKFEGVYALGSAITIGVQLALLATLALTPAIGSMFGAVAAYPVSYFISVRVVWKASGR